MIRSLLAASAVVAVAFPAAAETKYTLTGENTKVEFVGTKPNGKHVGGFKKLSGTATVADGGAVAIESEIDCTSLYSDDRSGKLTQHLKSPDFFGVKDHPTAKFKTTKVEKKDNAYVVTGELTMIGKTKEVSFPAEVQAGDTFVLKAEFKINRHDWGMSYGKGMIDDEVTIKVNVDAKK